MNITVEENERIKIILSAEELEKNEISFAELDYDNEKSRAFLQKLFFCSKSVTNFCKKGKNLEIEIFPAAKNGCIVYFTPTGEIKQVSRQRKLNAPKICTVTAKFSSADALLDFSKAIKSRRIPVKDSALYKSENDYYLIMTPYS
ncbi:MAG: adaptor protein MecA, partial [Acutalibacteraceae bacterium]